MQGEGGREKKEHDDQADVNEESKDDAAKLFLVHLEYVHDPVGGGMPENHRQPEEKKSENNSDNDHAQKQIAEQDDLFTIHVMKKAGKTEEGKGKRGGTGVTDGKSRSHSRRWMIGIE
jgi:hypothetical protein